MADETNEEHTTDAELSPDETGGTDEGHAAHTLGYDPDADEELGDDSWEGRLTLNHFNESVVGQLIVATDTRDFTLYMDGDAALRTIVAFIRHGRHEGLSDRLDPTTSAASAAWVALDLERVLALSWFPNLPGRSPRMVVDPTPMPA